MKWFFLAVNVLVIAACASPPPAPEWKPPNVSLKATPGRWDGHSIERVISARNEALDVCKAERVKADMSSNIQARLHALNGLHVNYSLRALNQHYDNLWAVYAACLSQRGFTMYPND